tara:strand:+ start:285 stop:476 length:192 start_codon:yes stop_codon:yes gene_type:complete
MSWIDVTVRLHEDEVKLLPMCLTDDGTYEGVLTNGIIAQIIRASKKNVDEHNPVYSYVYEEED